MSQTMKATDLLREQAVNKKETKHNITIYLSNVQIEKLDDLVHTTKSKSRSQVIGNLIEMSFEGII